MYFICDMNNIITLKKIILMIAFILNSRTGNDNEGNQKSGCLEEQGGRRASGCGVCLGRGSRNLSGEMKVL